MSRDSELVASLRARIAELKHEVLDHLKQLRGPLEVAEGRAARLQAEGEGRLAMLVDLQARLAAAEAQRDRLTRALRRYGSHQGECADNFVFAAVHNSKFGCTCGFDAECDSATDGGVTPALSKEERDSRCPPPIDVQLGAKLHGGLTPPDDDDYGCTGCRSRPCICDKLEEQEGKE